MKINKKIKLKMSNKILTMFSKTLNLCITTKIIKRLFQMFIH